MKIIKAQNCSADVIVSIVKTIIKEINMDILSDCKELCDVISESGINCEYLEDVSFLMTGMYDNSCVIVSEDYNVTSPILPIVCEDIVELVV